MLQDRKVLAIVEPSTRESHMKPTLLLIALLAAFPANAATAFFMYEQHNGTDMYKQCVYDLLGERFVITIPSVKLCPLTIEV
jgi:hypothetical protein